MKTRLILIAFLCVTQLKAQEWQTIPNSYFGTCCDLVSSVNFASRHFHINPYTQDMWMVYGAGACSRIDTEGNYTHFTWPEVNIFSTSYGFVDIDFTPDAVYAACDVEGLFEFKNGTWSQPIPAIDCESVQTEGDTVWVMVDGAEYIKLSNGLIENGTVQDLARSAHHKGNFWCSPNYYTGIANVKDGVYSFYNPDSINLLSFYNFDFKFFNNSDSLYLSGDLGISLAHNLKFIDSIDVNSSTNMPSGGIVEFEFDQQNNIWALFGNAENAFTFTNSGIGYYEQTTRSWTKYYDGSNSPIDFSIPVTIETDSSGNLWVAQKDRLHVLKTGNTPAWLGIAEQKHSSTFSLSPNPGTDILNIRLPQPDSTVALIQVWDAAGKLLESKKQLTGEQEVSWNLSSLAPGCYQITIEVQNQSSFPQRWIKL